MPPDTNRGRRRGLKPPHRLDVPAGDGTAAAAVPQPHHPSVRQPLIEQARQGGIPAGVADDGQRLLGTVVLTFAPQPNAPHRAEIGKMLVHSGIRRQGLGARLLTAAEQAATRHGRTLLLLDTASGSAGERLYRRCGWTEYGVVPDHSHTPDGVLAPATFFFKRLTAG